MQRAHSSQVSECPWQEATLSAWDDDFHAEATSSLEGLYSCALHQTSFTLCRLWPKHLYSSTVTISCAILNVQSSALHCKRELAHFVTSSVFPNTFAHGNYIWVNYFGMVFFHWHQPSSVCLALFVFIDMVRGAGVSHYFAFPQAVWKKRFTCIHNMNVWAAWPMNKKQESKHAKEID